MTHHQLGFHGADSLNGNAELNGTQITGKMTSGFGYIFNQKFPDLFTEPDKFLIIQFEQIIATVDSL